MKNVWPGLRFLIQLFSGLSGILGIRKYLILKGGRMEVSVILELHGHCVETAARREYKKLMDRLLVADDSDSETEEKVALLLAFLQESDFPALRASNDILAGDAGGAARLSRGGDGSLTIETLSSPPEE